MKLYLDNSFPSILLIHYPWYQSGLHHPPIQAREVEVPVAVVSGGGGVAGDKSAGIGGLLELLLRSHKVPTKDILVLLR